ncbi:30S ribosomal protein S6 [Luteolibacter ambystomatis]|uniref:Small ribosomal subunit protein bS6 n=1 Tax=Luteolibacter ambystomatis TaxID=2824561 RepID=A0A975G7I3_9BACT|nr:30S ribosomal protein S6 [Luteolibacter ambystomatis]QUE50195.1 30S ribosomal protein S6 [Luteolibacter ambystomatis]
MSRKYEGLIILNTKGVEGSVDETVASVAKELETEGAKVGEIKQIGRRKFAYESKHLDAGHYVTYVFTAEPAAISKIQARLTLNSKVHVQHYQRVA